MKKTILITGGAGFVGSNLAIFLKQKYQDSRIIALDNLKRRGSELNLKRLELSNIEFIHGDVRNSADLDIDDNIDTIIECSAEPSVLSGYGESPAYIIDTNLVGAINCMELARKKDAFMVFLSTSRIYPYDLLSKIDIEQGENRFSIGRNNTIAGVSENGISEEFPLDGVRSIYGATKLSAELLLREYADNYGLKNVINRCGVISGPWQMGKSDQGVFSFWIVKHISKKDLKYIGFGGRGLQVRDLLHIDDLCELIDIQINNKEKVNNKVYNVGGGNDISLSLIETTKICQEITGNKIEIFPEKENRHADIPLYISDYSKVRDELGWSPKKSAFEILQDTYSWMKENEKQLEKILF